VAEEVLVLSEDDNAAQSAGKSNKLPSHTATVTYYSLKGQFGLRRSFVPWEPKNSVTGVQGVEVLPDHAFMYFFDLRAVERLKNELNGRS